MAFVPFIKRKITTSLPGQKIIGESKNVYLPGFSGFSLYEVWTAFLLQMRRTSITERAAGISFNVFMAIPPTLIFVFTLIPYLPISKQVINQLFALIRDLVPGEKNNSVIINFLDDFINRPRNTLLSFGLITAVIFSSNAMVGILRSFDKDYPGFIRRRGLHRRLTALKLTLTAFISVFACLLMLIAQSEVLQWMGVESKWLQSLIVNLRWLPIVLLTFYIVASIYRHGPSITRKWPYLTPGSVFATTLMVIFTVSVTFWVNHFSNYNKLYGSIGAVFILMSLIYANALAILIGFELNVTLTSMRQEKELLAAKQDS